MRWFRDNRLGLLVVFAALLRIVYYWQSWLGNINFHFPQSDQANYLKIGDYFRHGNWLSVEGIYTAPLYPYLAALLVTPGLIVAVQMLAGLLTTLVLVDLGRRYYANFNAGLWAALLFNLCAPLICYEAKIYPTALAIDALLVGLWLLERAKDGAHFWRRLCLSGGCFAVAVGFITSQLLSLFLLLGLLPVKRGATKTKVMAVFLLPLFAMLVAFALRNYMIDKSFMPLGANMGMNLAIGHQANSDGGYKVLPGFDGTKETEQIKSKVFAEAALQRPLNWHEVDGYWRAQALQFMMDHPLAELSLIAKKIGLFFSDKDLSSEVILVYEQGLTPVLRFLPVSFVILCLLAFSGPLLRRHWPLPVAVVFFVVVVTNLLFFVTERLRLPAAGVLVLPAGATLAVLFDKGTARWRWLQLVTGIVVVALLILNILARPTPAQRRMGDYNRAITYESAEQIDEALALQQKLYEEKPAALIAHSTVRLLLLKQDLKSAQRWAEQGLQAFPTSVELHNDTGVIALRNGDYELARQNFAKVLAMNRSVVVAYRNLGLALVGLKKYKEAFPIYQEYVKLAPGDARGKQELQQLQMQLAAPKK